MNIRMTTTRTKTDFFRNSDNANIVYYLSIGNMVEIKRLINTLNVDDIIDDKNNYTALHYAIRFGNKEIIDYLLSINSSITKKNINNEDALDLCLKYQNRDLITNTLNDKNTKISNLKKDIDTLERKHKMVETNNTYLVRSVDNLVEKNDALKHEIISAQQKNKELLNSKKVVEEDFNKLKRKYSSLESSYDGLLEKMRK
jgi:FtsZ-binding cell division protein ZapB